METAIKYYSILSTLNDFKWSPLEIKIIAFTCIEGNISTGGRKEKFCSLFKSSKSSVFNSISDLAEKFFLVKKERKVLLHPQLILDFSQPISITLNLDYEAS